MSLIRATMTCQGVAFSATLDASPSSRAWVRSFKALRTADQSQHRSGVWLWSRRWPDGTIQWALREANSLVRRDGTGFCGAFRFEALTLELLPDPFEHGAAIYSPPRPGQVVQTLRIDLVSAGVHEMPARRGFSRRGIIAPAGANAATLWKRITSHAYWPFAVFRKAWGPAREVLPLPSMDYHAALGGRADQLQAMLESGAKGRVESVSGHDAPIADLRTTPMGPYHVDGDTEAGAPAGYEINVCLGWEQSGHALRIAELQHETTVPRIAYCHDLVTGEPIDPSDWTNRQLAYPEHRSGDQDQAMRGRRELVAFMSGGYGAYRIKQADGATCPYSAALAAYDYDDTAHIVRAFDDAAALAGWADDAMARDDLVCLGRSHAHADWQLRLDDRPNNSDGLGYVHPTLTKFAWEAANNHGHGHPKSDRAFGWMMALRSWERFALPADRRARVDAWLRKALDTYLHIVDACGIPQRESRNDPSELPAGVQGSQHFHSALVHHGAWIASRTIGYRTSEVLEKIRLWRANVCQNPQMPYQPRADSPGALGPPKWLHRFKSGDGEYPPPLTTARSNGGGFQEHVLALLGREAQSRAELGDTASRHACLAFGIMLGLPAMSIAAKRAQIELKPHDLSQEASWLAIAQEAQ